MIRNQADIKRMEKLLKIHNEESERCQLSIDEMKNENKNLLNEDDNLTEKLKITEEENKALKVSN